jgi:membrane protein YdbS with pleckstrin-like domain
MTSPDDEPSHSTDWHPLHPAVATIRRGITLAAGLATSALLVVLTLLSDDTSSWWFGRLIACLLIGMVPAALVAVFVTSHCRSWRYRFGDDALEVHHGVWWRTLAAVPYQRIQQVEVEHGPLQRRFGVVSLALRTASARSLGALPGIAVDDAEAVRRMLLQRAGRDDGA